MAGEGRWGALDQAMADRAGEQLPRQVARAGGSAKELAAKIGLAPIHLAQTMFWNSVHNMDPRGKDRWWVAGMAVGTAESIALIYLPGPVNRMAKAGFNLAATTGVGMAFRRHRMGEEMGLRGQGLSKDEFDARLKEIEDNYQRTAGRWKMFFGGVAASGTVFSLTGMAMSAFEAQTGHTLIPKIWDPFSSEGQPQPSGTGAGTQPTAEPSVTALPTTEPSLTPTVEPSPTATSTATAIPTVQPTEVPHTATATVVTEGKGFPAVTTPTETPTPVQPAAAPSPEPAPFPRAAPAIPPALPQQPAMPGEPAVLQGLSPDTAEAAKNAASVPDSIPKAFLEKGWINPENGISRQDVINDMIDKFAQANGHKIIPGEKLSSIITQDQWKIVQEASQTQNVHDYANNVMPDFQHTLSLSHPLVPPEAPAAPNLPVSPQPEHITTGPQSFEPIKSMIETHASSMPPGSVVEIPSVPHDSNIGDLMVKNGGYDLTNWNTQASIDALAVQGIVNHDTLVDFWGQMQTEGNIPANENYPIQSMADWQDVLREVKLGNPEAIRKFRLALIWIPAGHRFTIIKQAGIAAILANLK